jgi:phage gp46-like protein
MCRSQLSYGRYWEGRTNLQLMTSKLTDAVVMTLTFDREAVPKVNPTEEQVNEHQWFRDTVVHLGSLLHAVALATLRTDYNMENIVVRASVNNASILGVTQCLTSLYNTSFKPEASVLWRGLLHS